MARSMAYLRSKAAVTEMEIWCHLLDENAVVREQAEGKDLG